MSDKTKRNTGRETYRASSWRTKISQVIVLGLLCFPLVSHAGIFSLFAGLLGRERPSADAFADNSSRGVALLQAAVNPDPNPAKGGGDITIVEGSALLSENGPSGTIANVSDTHDSGHISLYVVHEGDSLARIAKLFGVSTNTVMWANNLTRNSVLKAGDTLVILPISGVRHTVAKGDTLASIAKKYKADKDEIAQYNDLADGALVVGDTLVVPDGEIAAAPVRSRTGGTVRGGGPVYEGYYLRPVSGAKKTQGIHGYNGIDLGAPIGTPVLASASGQVIVARSSGWNGGYGKYIVVKHDNGTQTLYAHLNGLEVEQGYSVIQGQVIGYVGTTGKSTGPHLHFEVRGATNPF